MRLVIAHFAFDPETPVDALAPICNRLLDVERGERNLAHVIDRVMRYRAECLGQWDVCWGDRILRDRAERLSFAAQTPTPLSRLVDVFPAARFLHVVRDGCDVVCANQRDGAAGLADTAKSWVDDVAEFRRFTGAHAARSLELRYESTRRDPAAARREICRFLGVEVDWSQDPISIETVVGRERFAPAVLRELQGLIGQELAAWGYPPCTA